MAFCTESYDSAHLGEIIARVAKTTTRLSVGSFGDDKNEIIQQIALVYRLQDELTEIIEFSKNNTARALICKVIEGLNLEKYIEEAEKHFEAINQLIEEFDTAVSNIPTSTDFESIENSVSILFSVLDDKIVNLTKLAKEKLKEAFSILTVIGATEQQITDALDIVEFQPNIKDYIFEVFEILLVLTLNELSDEGK